MQVASITNGVQALKVTEAEDGDGAESAKASQLELEGLVDNAWRYIQCSEFKLKLLLMELEAQKTMETLLPITDFVQLPLRILFEGGIPGMVQLPRFRL